jgi:hypothetical protein
MGEVGRGLKDLKKKSPGEPGLFFSYENDY